MPHRFIGSKMDKKTKIDETIKQLEELYSPDDAFKAKIKPQIDQLYTVPEDKVDWVLGFVENAYKGYQERNRALQATKESCKQISKNLEEIATNYKTLVSGVSQIYQSMATIAQKAAQAEKNLKEQTQYLTETKENIGKTNEVLADAKVKLDDLKDTLVGKIEGSKDPKTLN